MQQRLRKTAAFYLMQKRNLAKEQTTRRCHFQFSAAGEKQKTVNINKSELLTWAESAGTGATTTPPTSRGRMHPIAVSSFNMDTSGTNQLVCSRGVSLATGRSDKAQETPAAFGRA